MASPRLTGESSLSQVEQQYSLPRVTVLQPSSTLTYTVSASAPAGTAADPCSGQKVSNVQVGGEPLDVAASYQVTVNNFLADGGDGFSQLRLGTDRVLGVDDLDALIAYLGDNDPISAPATDRITVG